MSVDIQAVCRLCLSNTRDALKSIFDDVLGPNRLPQKIEQLVVIQVTRNDRVSTMVCNDCIIRLDTWFSYKKQCHRNQAKLAEWLGKFTGQNTHDVNIHIKTEPLDMDASRHVKVEYPMFSDMMDEEFSDLPHSFSFSQNSDHVYLEDLGKMPLESEETSVKCSECGKLFGSVTNRRRHQNMVHRRDRRAQMMEIKKVQLEPPTEPEPEQNSESIAQNTAENTTENTTESTTEQNSTSTIENENQSTQSLNNSENDTSVNMDVSAPEISTTEIPKEDSSELPSQIVTENMPSTEDNQEKPVENTEETKENQDESTEPAVMSEEKETVDKTLNSNQDQQNEKPVKTEDDQQKIEFAAGLKLVQKDSPLIEFEALSKIELSYIEKCKAMVSMFHSLQCACHNVQHKSLRHLLSHLREVRVWFPLFTCYSCMISFTDRSTFTRHHCRCPKGPLETLIKLSNLRKRSEIKTRLYQNYKCNRCKFLYSFHEDFCKHINEDHSSGLPPIYCSCRNVFETVEEYKTHCYTSCVLSFYCDICFITTATIQEFVKHCEEIHDTSEGFVLLQDDSYIPRNTTFRHKEVDEEANVIEGKRERRRSTKEPIMVQIYDREIPPDPKEIPTKVLRQMIQLDFTPTTANEWNRKPTKCPVCRKEYSSVNNMIRHYRTHVERKEVELPTEFDETGNGNEDLYSCPECGGMYPASRWKKHLEEKHSPVTCTECDKVFQFQSELEQHRSVHLNLKVYRDSKTHAYKTAILSPSAETNGVVGEIMVMCEICDAMFKSKEELKHHKLTCHDINISRASSSMENFEMPVEDPLSIPEPAEDMEDEVDVKEHVSTDSSDIEKLPCDSCGKIYSSAKSLKEHIMNKHGLDFVKKSEFPKKCDYCDKVCTSGAGLALHTQVHERCNPDKKGEFPKKCEYCDKICTTGAGLYLHTQMHERMTLGDIKKEKIVAVKVEEKQQSVEEDQEEDESYHTCKRCFKVFGTKGKLKDHMRSHGINPSKLGSKTVVKKIRKILCDLCHLAVDSSDDLAKHKAEEHSDELDGMPTLTNEMEVDEQNMPFVYTCDVCVQTFDSKLELQQHKETHGKSTIVPKTTKSQIYCKYCKIAFESVNELTKHMHLEHGESAKPKVIKEKSGEEKSFKCPMCPKAFATHGALTAHCGWHKRAGSTIEITDRRENTPQATAAAKMAKKRKISQKIAQAAAFKQEPIIPPEFQCTTCLMELPNETALQIHILERHRNLDSLMLIPRCDTCNLDFVTQEEYETHKRFHDFLNRQKKHEEQLQAQQYIQTPIIQSVQSVSESPQGSPKRHPCNWCNSVFSRSDTLNTHIKQHHKEHVRTEFECTQCDRVFDKQNSLTIHLKVHEKQKSSAMSSTSVAGNGISGAGKIFSCSICSQCFNFPKDLRMHTINAHPF